MRFYRGIVLLFLFFAAVCLGNYRCSLEKLGRIELEGRINTRKSMLAHLQEERAAHPNSPDTRVLDYHINRIEKELFTLKSWGALPGENFILDTDSYKSSHYKQLPPGLTHEFAYLEARGGKYDKTVFFGLQYILKNQFSKPITPQMVEQAKAFFEAHGEPFNYEGWMYIAKNLGGRLPLRIRAVPEGSVVPTSNMLMSVENTDPHCAWLVGWVEAKLMRVWYPTTVATQSYHTRDTIQKYLNLTSDNPQDGILFKLHDFGARGVSSQGSAAIGGAAHLVAFRGSDTTEGVHSANYYYDDPMAGFSIPAMEHGSIISWGANGELPAMENMIKQFSKKGKLYAIVIDSYDPDNAVQNILGDKLKKLIVESGGTLVARPDSGVPEEVVLKTVKELEAKFGATKNSKGYKVLNHARVIQGDGINHESIDRILKVLTDAGYSADNLAFGEGSGLLQQPTRDTVSFAYKPSWGVVDGEERDMKKAPKTAHGSKSSKPGRLDTIYRDGKWQTIREADGSDSQMRDVWVDGALVTSDNMATIRGRADAARGPDGISQLNKK